MTNQKTSKTLNGTVTESVVPPIAGQAVANPIMPNLGFGGEDLLSIQKQVEAQKRKSGYCLLFLLVILYVAGLIVSVTFLRSRVLLIWLSLIFLGLLLPVLFTKFDVLDLLIDKFVPFLREPEDFLKRKREVSS